MIYQFIGPEYALERALMKGHLIRPLPSRGSKHPIRFLLGKQLHCLLVYTDVRSMLMVLLSFKGPWTFALKSATDGNYDTAAAAGGTTVTQHRVMTSSSGFDIYDTKRV